MILSAPIWLYQFWAFIAPGLHARERRWAYFFAGAAVPLFAARRGTIAYFAMTGAWTSCSTCCPQTSSPSSLSRLTSAIALAMLLIFGLAFELPLVMVLLNVAGVLTHQRFAKWRRMIIFACVRVRGGRDAEPRSDQHAAAGRTVRGTGGGRRGIRLGQRPASRPPRGGLSRSDPGGVTEYGLEQEPVVASELDDVEASASSCPHGAAGNLVGSWVLSRARSVAPGTTRSLDRMTKSGSPASPADRYAAYMRGRKTDEPELAAFQALYDFALDDFQVAGLPGARGRPRRAASPRRPARARRWSASSPSTWRWPGPQVLLHHADQGAVEPEVRRPGRALRRRPGRPADRRQQHQRRGAGRGHDHRGAAQHALRRLADAGRASATW